MHWRISFLVACVCLSKCLYASETTTNWRSKDGDIFIDNDEGIEGSGGDRELKNDLEASGSGAGPDDEDTVPDPLTPVVKLPPPTTERKDDVPPVVSVTTRKTPSTFDEVNTINEPKERPKLDPNDNSVTIMNQKPPYEDRAASFFAQPGILAAVIGGAVVGLLCAILVVMFIVYRMRKKDEGSYALDEPKRSPLVNSYGKGHQTEFYA